MDTKVVSVEDTMTPSEADDRVGRLERDMRMAAEAIDSLFEASEEASRRIEELTEFCNAVGTVLPGMELRGQFAFWCVVCVLVFTAVNAVAHTMGWA